MTIQTDLCLLLGISSITTSAQTKNKYLKKYKYPPKAEIER